MELFLLMLMLFLFFFLIAVIICAIVTYIFMGLSLYGAAEIDGVRYKWFAWVPILNMVLLFKLGNKEWKYYIGLILGETIISIMQEYTDSGILLVVEVVLFILVLIVLIQAYLNISKKYEINPAWFIVGEFFPPIMLVAYIIFYNRIRKLEILKSIEQIKEKEEAE